MGNLHGGIKIILAECFMSFLSYANFIFPGNSRTIGTNKLQKVAE